MLGAAIDIALALSTGSGQTSPVVRSIEIAGSTGEERLSKAVTSPPVELAGVAVDILDVESVMTTTGAGTITITASLQAEDGSWSDFMPLADIRDQKAKAVVFRAEVSVETIDGADSANLASITIHHRTDGVATFTEGVGRIVTVTLDLYNDQSKAHAMVKWHPVKDAGIRGYASFRASPVQVNDEVLGTADGTSQHFDLAHPVKVAPHTLVIKVNGMATPSYSFNSSTGEITISAAAGTSITASYQYNWEPEVWQPMIHEASYPDTKNVLLTNEQFNLSTLDAGPIVSFMAEVEQGKGSVEAEELGAATGIETPYILAHRPKPGAIVVKANGSPIDTGQYHFSEIGQVLYITATSGSILTVDYDWLGESPEVASIAAVWNR
ncbi:MAG: hypothetical protein LBO21_02710 [Synergistaceae bacterium]|nr:hypothetical protein [Synergistaceae bacterium]